jgi:hypothetical protein
MTMQSNWLPAHLMRPPGGLAHPRSPSLVLTAGWAAVAGTPAITCAATILERIGNSPSR